MIGVGFAISTIARMGIGAISSMISAGLRVGSTTSAPWGSISSFSSGSSSITGTASKSQLIGTRVVINNLRRVDDVVAQSAMRGLIKASVVIMRDMEKTPPIIPIDTGNLRASRFTTSHWEGKNPRVVLGFSAYYAVFVHENLEAKNWSRPGSGPKFLEAAIKRNEAEVKRILVEEISKVLK